MLDYPTQDKAGTVLDHTHIEGSMHTIILKLVDAHRSVILALDRCKKKLPEEAKAEIKGEALLEGRSC